MATADSTINATLRFKNGALLVLVVILNFAMGMIGLLVGLVA